MICRRGVVEVLSALPFSFLLLVLCFLRLSLSPHFAVAVLRRPAENSLVIDLA